MQGENQRSLSTMLLVAGAFLAVYYASTYFFGDGATTDETATEQVELSPEQRAQQEAERRRDSDERQSQRAIGTITTDEMVATIDNLGGGLMHVELLGERYQQAESRLDLVSTTNEELRPLRIDLPGIGIPADAVWELEQESARAVRLRWEGNGVEVVRRIEAGDGPYQLWQTVRVKNLAPVARDTRFRVSTFHYVRREDEGGGFLGNRSPAMSQGLCRHDGDTERKEREGLTEERHGYRDAVEFVALENVYFVTALAPDGEQAEVCGLHATDRGNVDGEPEGAVFEATLLYPVVEIPAGGEKIWRHLTFVGPKIPGALERAGHGLPEVVNLGTFAIIARAFTSLLRFIYGYVGNWGIAIILLTILVRIALFPIMERQFRSMAGMRKLKPEMDEINARFASDPEKKQAAIMDMYRRHGINPLAQLSGCLPVLLQMPVFFALYTSLSTNVELYHQPFTLWWQDLSAPDPFFVLPIAIGGLMFLQQKLTPTSMDPAQAKVMQFMPVMVTVFMLFLPAGLCVYMLTNSSLSMAQQKLNQMRTDRKDATAAATPATVVDGSAVDGAAPVGDDSKAGRGGGGGNKPSSPRGSGRSRRG